VEGSGKLRPKLGQPASTSLFLPFLLHYSVLYLNHHHFGK
jgi:hypothetical protein